MKYQLESSCSIISLIRITNMSPKSYYYKEKFDDDDDDDDDGDEIVHPRCSQFTAV